MVDEWVLQEGEGQAVMQEDGEQSVLDQDENELKPVKAGDLGISDTSSTSKATKSSSTTLPSYSSLTVEPATSPSLPWPAGRGCVARWEKDDTWYRAEVLGFQEYHVRVALLDYGREAEVPRERVRWSQVDIPEGEAVDCHINLEVNMNRETAQKPSPPGESLPQKVLTEGMAVIALFSEDGTWYNAEVLEVLGGGSWRLIFSDYGNTELVREEHIVNSIGQLGEDDLVDEFVLGKWGDSSKTQGEESEVAKSDKNCVKKGHLLVKKKSEENQSEKRVIDIDEKIVADVGSHGLRVSSEDIPEGELVDHHLDLQREIKSENKMVDRQEEALTEDTDVIALYSEDNTWYYARVLEVLEGARRLIFTDYGNMEVVIVKNIVMSIQQLPDGALVDDFVQMQIDDDKATEEEGTVNNEKSKDKEQLSLEKEIGETLRGEMQAVGKTGGGNQDSFINETKDAKYPTLNMMTSHDINVLIKLETKCLAVWQKDGVLYRAQLLTWYKDLGAADVLFTDYDNVDVVGRERIYRTWEEVPADFPLEQVDCHVQTGQGEVELGRQEVCLVSTQF